MKETNQDTKYVCCNEISDLRIIASVWVDRTLNADGLTLVDKDKDDASTHLVLTYQSPASPPELTVGL